ncbi:serine hydrolase domain-containing protein [Steroidobacter sp.]|uniref:serine hydrolase domain-containing protein n=1 Tax=Steroidobacter sp. TaxID=1978227 RepID=UPI001A3F4195|nr:serine hydrolase domain-containing protein [Steroidobacter sp.]MBL8271591.1 beta-lactamase family protein [Steroidobacter sp.]
MRKLMRWGLLVLAFQCSAASAAALSERDIEALRSEINTALVEQSVPSLAVAVAKDGKILWQQGFGWADRERRIAATEHTTYSLASISKPITATALMMLVQAGKVDLDAPANDYLGSVKLRSGVGDVRLATVRRVANHMAGLPDHFNPFYADEPYRAPSMDETLRRYGFLLSVPSEHTYYEYSNLGYGVLDYIVERVSGRSYANFLRNEVFIPLGMTRSSVGVAPGLEPYVATRYDPDGVPLPAYDFDSPGASAVYASAHDLLRFGIFHVQTPLPDQKAILSGVSLNEMHRRTSGDAAMGYSVGFNTIERSGYQVVSHGGVMAGVSTLLLMVPEEKLAVVVLCNSKTPLADVMAEKIVARVLPRWRVQEPRRRKAPALAAPPKQVVGLWRGQIETYQRNVPIELDIHADGDVHAKVGDGLPTLVDGASFSEGVLTGTLAARIGTPDTERYDYEVSLWLTLRGDVMNGSATAQGGDRPRVRGALAHWTQLTKQ